MMVGDPRRASRWRRFALGLAVLASVLLAVGGGLGDAWLCAMSGARSGPCQCTAAAQEDHTPVQVGRASCCSRTKATASATATPTRTDGWDAAGLAATPTEPSSRRPAVVSRRALPVRGPPPHGPPTYLVHQSLLL